MRRRHDDLSIDDGAAGQLLEKDLMQLGEVPIQRPEIATLDKDVVFRGPAKHDRAKAVPLGLEQEVAIARQIVGEFREHRLDRRSNRQRRSSWHGVKVDCSDPVNELDEFMTLRNGVSLLNRARQPFYSK